MEKKFYFLTLEGLDGFGKKVVWSSEIADDKMVIAYRASIIFFTEEKSPASIL